MEICITTELQKQCQHESTWRACCCSYAAVSHMRLSAICVTQHMKHTHKMQETSLPPYILVVCPIKPAIMNSQWWTHTICRPAGLSVIRNIILNGDSCFCISHFSQREFEISLRLWFICCGIWLFFLILSVCCWTICCNGKILKIYSWCGALTADVLHPDKVQR